MSARILDGKQIARAIQQETAGKVAEFTKQSGVQPCLAAVLVGDDPASQVYVRSKRRACERIGLGSQLHHMPADLKEADLLALIAELNADQAVHGILVQLPLPKHIRETAILDAVLPAKDVDCFHPENVGRMVQGRPRFLPCTPHGVLQILYRSEIPTTGKHAVVIGRSEIVGKPLASMLQQKDATLGPEYANATVTVCHSRTPNLAEVANQADILIAAIGRPKWITADMIKPGATVVDVGINRTDDGLVGDVDFEPACQVAGAITPVPGGVGPLTIAMVLLNTLVAAQGQS